MTDPLQIIATGLDVLDTKDLFPFLKKYCAAEKVDKIVIGYPFFDHVFNEEFKKKLDIFIVQIKKTFAPISVDLHDESFTSVKAKEIIFNSGAKKKKRRQKKLIDKVSAIIILQEYLGHI